MLLSLPECVKESQYLIHCSSDGIMVQSDTDPSNLPFLPDTYALGVVKPVSLSSSASGLPFKIDPFCVESGSHQQASIVLTLEALSADASQTVWASCPAEVVTRFTQHNEEVVQKLSCDALGDTTR
jgi:hypothetical protein